MAKIRLEVMPWLTRAFGVKGLGRLIREEEVEAGATVRDLFNQLSTEYKDFAELVFDPNAQELTGMVSVIFNDRLLELAGGIDARICDGDTITLLPAYAGGCDVEQPKDERRNLSCQHP